MKFYENPSFGIKDVFILLKNNTNKICLIIGGAIICIFCFPYGSTTGYEAAITAIGIVIIDASLTIMDFIVMCISACRKQNTQFIVKDNQIIRLTDNSHILISEAIILIVLPSAVSDFGKNLHLNMLNGTMNGQFSISIITVNNSPQKTVENLFRKTMPTMQVRKEGFYVWKCINSEELQYLMDPESPLFQCRYSPELIELFTSMANCSLVTSDDIVNELKIDLGLFDHFYGDGLGYKEFRDLKL